MDVLSFWESMKLKLIDDGVDSEDLEGRVPTNLRYDYDGPEWELTISGGAPPDFLTFAQVRFLLDKAAEAFGIYTIIIFQSDYLETMDSEFSEGVTYGISRRSFRRLRRS